MKSTLLKQQEAKRQIKDKQTELLTRLEDYEARGVTSKLVNHLSQCLENTEEDLCNIVKEIRNTKEMLRISESALSVVVGGPLRRFEVQGCS